MRDGSWTKVFSDAPIPPISLALATAAAIVIVIVVDRSSMRNVWTRERQNFGYALLTIVPTVLYPLILIFRSNLGLSDISIINSVTFLLLGGMFLVLFSIFEQRPVGLEGSKIPPRNTLERRANIWALLAILLAAFLACTEP